MKVEKLRMPFEVKRIRRQPGQSAGEKWRTILDEEFETVVLALVGVVGVGIVAVIQSLGIVVPLWLFGMLFLGVICWMTFKMVMIRRRVRTWRLGENGEQYVGQMLERNMRPIGYDVFHDVVIKKAGRVFNLDHVLIGVNGVYVVETKAWRKPVMGSPEIEFRDGCLYRMGHKIKNDAVKEAISLAKAANELFFELTGRRYYVKPILVIAGWYCKCNNGRDMSCLLMNEKQVGAWIKNYMPPSKIDSKDIELLRIKLEQYDV